MALINYDLYDVYALIQFFRLNPERADYIPALQAVTAYLAEPSGSGSDYNGVRNVLRPYVDPQEKMLAWVFVENVYTGGVRLLKNPAYRPMLCAALREIEDALADSDGRTYEAAYACHNLPLLMAEDTLTKKAALSFTEHYRKTYNSDFLCAECKNLK